MLRNARLIHNPETPEEQFHPFTSRIVVGRKGGISTETETIVRIVDPAISGRHCVVRQADDGRFFIRDESRNGTRVEGRRLVPNVEVEIYPGNRIQVAQNHSLLLVVEPTAEERQAMEEEEDSTCLVSNVEVEVTVLVGDIANYTVLNQRYNPADVYQPVNRVFSELETVVAEFHGTIKEYQGDAIFAFWEHDPADPNWHAQQACHAALGLLKKVREIATQPNIWTIADFPLEMEFALTTGNVLITTIGGDRPIGLAMVGDTVNYAFRLEKLANEDTGKILVCQRTVERAKDQFTFRDIGKHQVKGREEAETVYVLEGTRVEPRRAAAETIVLTAIPDDEDTGKF
ncbi:MAG: adenylate/guanylate cyclase domain-containing protein [Bradymonadales bacterium]|nr:adenylate/guanylate cyclase domain-containing protein [Bradymonadales bacterium]